jgi:hypothetical protein
MPTKLESILHTHESIEGRLAELREEKRRFDQEVIGVIYNEWPAFLQVNWSKMRNAVESGRR